MTQDKRGVVYFGGDSLWSYDGARWTHSPIAGAYAVKGLDFGEDGRLWASAAGEMGWFQRADSGPWKFHSLRQNLPPEHAEPGEIWSVWAEHGGAIFVSADKVFRWNGKRFEIWSMPGARRLASMRVGHRVYIHHVGTGLYVMGPSGLEKVADFSELGTASVTWIEPKGTGWLVAAYSGLYEFQDGKMEAIAPAASDFIRQNIIVSAVRLTDGRLAVGTYRGGIGIVGSDGSLQRILTERDGLPTSIIFSLKVDRQGALWATSLSGVFRISLTSLTSVFDRRANLPVHPTRSILRDGNRLLIGNESGVYALDPGSGHFAREENLPLSVIHLGHSPGGLLMSSLTSAKKFHDGQVTLVHSNPRGVFLTKPSRKWPDAALISEGGAIMLATADGQVRPVVTNLPDIVTSMCEDYAGRIWLGTATRGVLGALLPDTGSVDASRPDQAKALVGPNESAAVVSDSDGRILLFGEHGGWLLNRASDQFEAINNYPDESVSAVTEVGTDGAVWAAYVAKEKGGPTAARIKIENGRAQWQPHFVEGLGDVGSLWSIFAEPSPAHGTVLWIGGSHGVLRNEVSAAGPILRRPQAPLVTALMRTAEHDELSALTATLPYSNRSVVFEVATPEFDQRNLTRIETRIDGIDERWIPAETNGRRDLTALRDGRYAFHARVVGGSGAISEITSVRFEVLPPWWRSTPAVVALLLALGPLAYGGYRLRLRSLHRRNAELEAKVSQRTEELARASAAKTEFVAAMSHDIRNPLNGIIGLALALEDSELDPRQREMVATLRECSTFLSTLVDDVLDFASIESGRVELKFAPFAPEQLLRSVVATLKADADSRQAALVVEADRAVAPLLLGDAARIQQILVNYVSNALKYAGGTIRLSVRIPANARGEVEFSVTDRGPGIDGPEQANLFTKFHRLDAAQRSTIKGTGLGLASCRHLADLMGGSVGVDSAAGRGARFFLRLPLTEAELVAPVPAIAGEVHNTTVLLVEDADYNALAATAVLARLGLSCERARDGAEALRLFSEKRFNLVLLDRNLPDMDGTEVARRMRVLEEDGPRAILLALTAYCTPADRALCIEAGMDAFVGKPLTPDKLRKILVAAGRRLLTAASVHVSPGALDPGLNVELLDYMADGTDAGFREQIARFLGTLSDSESRLDAATRVGDFVTVGDVAHFIVSQARLIGTAALCEAAMALEDAARAREPRALDELVHSVRREIAAVRVAMNRVRPAAQTA